MIQARRLCDLGADPEGAGCKIQAVGVQNVYLPHVHSWSLLDKEKDHVEGFAPSSIGYPGEGREAS